MKGTMTSHVQLPRRAGHPGQLRLGDRMSVFRDEELNCRDLWGENCRMTITVRMENGESVRSFLGRRCAMGHRDYYSLEARGVSQARPGGTLKNLRFASAALTHN